MDTEDLPLGGLRAIEFTHMVMGPSAGVILADLGVEVTRIEPIGGDRTRALTGSGAGYFPMYNRNKRSICLNLKHPDGLQFARQLAADADIVIENFRPGTMERIGLGLDVLQSANPRLIYCSAKGFLDGPYESRAALDEVAQMMGGLAYMTGPPGKPLRAGASVIDVTGGMFGVIGILAALRRRDRTGKGAHVKCSLYETTAFLVGQHMAQMAVTGIPAAPMPVRVSAWAVYDVFEARGGKQFFVAVVSDAQWQAFCAAFGFESLARDPTLAINNERVAARGRILPVLRETFARLTCEAILQRLESAGVPGAKIARPEDLFDDAQLNVPGGLLDLTLDDGRKLRLPALPLQFDGSRLGVRRDLAQAGADSRELLSQLGLSDAKIDSLVKQGVVG